MSDDCLNIIVIGCNGKLGRDLMELFEYEDKQKFFVHGVDIEDCDITKKDDLENLLDGTKGSISNVINCSAMTDVDSCEIYPDKAFKINSEAVKMLADVCLKNEIHLTHISTDYVFDGMNPPYMSDSKTNPLNEYGRTKLEGMRERQRERERGRRRRRREAEKERRFGRRSAQRRAIGEKTEADAWPREDAAPGIAPRKAGFAVIFVAFFPRGSAGNVDKTAPVRSNVPREA